jgi:hypothetical protein
MTLLMPPYIKNAKVADAPINYDWDDDDPEEAYLDPDERLRHRIGEISDRGVVALSAGFAEWIAWRLSKHSDTKLLFQVIEAVWAGIVDWSYFEQLDAPDFSDWQGSVRGPICAAINLLDEIIYLITDGQFASPESVCLTQLALHVLPDPKPFKDWRRSTIKRLAAMYPRRPDDRLGTPVPREALDPAFDYKHEMEEELTARFLKGLDWKQNPSLRSPEAMKEDGFEGTPYLR